MNPLRHKFLPFSFAVSFIGLAFSVYNILSTFMFEELCFENCNVFASFTFMGFSLWWISAVVFVSILILSLFGIASVIRLLTALALFFDVFLFLIMLSTAFCVMCAGVGLIFACSYYVIRFENRRPMDPYPRTWLLSTWCIVFVALLGSAYNSDIEGYAIKTADENTSTNIFFSPSCPACKQVIQAEHLNGNIAWYPVEENENDVWRVILIKKRLAQGDSLYQAYLEAEAQKPEEHVSLMDGFSLDYLKMQFVLWKNSAIVKRRSQVVPYIEVFGSPKSLVRENLGQEKGISLQDSMNVPQGNAIENLIGKENNLCGDEAKPCDEIQ